MAERAANIPYDPSPPAPSGEVAQNGSSAGSMNISASPAAFGAQVGGALEKFGKTGEELAQHYGEMAVHTAVNDQYVNGYAPQVNALTSQFKQLQGTEAVKQLPAYQQKLKELNDQYQNQGGGVQRELMGGLLRYHSLQTLNTFSNHADQQLEQHQNVVTAQSIKNASDEAMNNWQDAGQVDFNVNRAIGISNLNAIRKLGYDSDSQQVAAQMAREDGSKVARSAIDMAVDSGDYQTARLYAAKYKGILSGKDQLEVQKNVNSLSVQSNASSIADNFLTGNFAIPSGSPQHMMVQDKADVASLAQKEGLDPNVAFALHGAESDYGHGVTEHSRLKDDFQTDPKYRDKGYEDDGLASSVHNAAKIWKANGNDLASRMERDITPSEGYLAYNQGGAGAEALLNAGLQDTAVQALSKIMSVKDATAHVNMNGGTPTMSAADFSQHIQELFQNHYDTQKVKPTEDLPAAIRGQANLQLPAVQPTSDPHGFFEQISQRLPAAIAASDNIPDDKVRESVQKQLKLKYETAKLADTAWKNTQADTANKYGEDPRYTSMDQIPTTVKNDLQNAGQLSSLERQLNDKRNPKKDNTYGGDAFLRTMGRLATDDEADAITDVAGLQQAYGDNPELHSSGFNKLRTMVKGLDNADGKAVVSTQFQYLSALRQKMVAGESDDTGKKAFEAALPQFFEKYADVAAGKAKASDVLSLDPDNKNSFTATLKLPTSSEMTSKKIDSASKWLTSTYVWGDQFGGKEEPAAPNFTPMEKVMDDFMQGRISKEDKDAQLRRIASQPKVPRPE